MKYTVREIEEKDNIIIEGIIRSCLTEFGAAHDGTAWADPYLGRFSEVYVSEGNKYWVAEDENGKVVAGVGIGGFEETPDVCELQKMYCLPEARGTGVARMLMDTAMKFAKRYYSRCYLETMDSMIAAKKLYEKYGFYRIYEPVVDTGHYNCNILYIKDF